MGLIEVIVPLIILGAVLMIVNTIPMEATVKKVINIIALLFICLWLLRCLAGWDIQLWDRPGHWR